MLASINQEYGNPVQLHFVDDTMAIGDIKIVSSLEKVMLRLENIFSVFQKQSRKHFIIHAISVEEMSASDSAISQVTIHISDIISRLENRSTEIGTILDVINEVAEQHPYWP